ncbi:hypothetical protein KY345_00190 [Candidatus Woesearchaeota archaeon]|nr:hypothetical protein [Candidatus Woesearchaeota archaeon]
MKIPGYWLYWAEYFMILLMVIGFLVAITLDSMWLNIVVIFIAGLMAGRLLYGREKKHKFTHYLIVIGFLIGYLLGSYSFNKKMIAAVFIGSAILSYYLHKKGYVEKYLPVYDPHKQHW